MTRNTVASCRCQLSIQTRARRFICYSQNVGVGNAQLKQPARSMAKFANIGEVRMSILLLSTSTLKAS